jgi:hypothetical protein
VTLPLSLKTDRWLLLLGAPFTRNRPPEPRPAINSKAEHAEQKHHHQSAASNSQPDAGQIDGPR